VRAQLFYHIHQFQKSKEDLLAARAQGGPPDGEHAILLLEFDNALNRDDFVEAEEILHDLLSTKQGFEEYSRKAQWEFRKGQTEKSLKTLAESRSHVTVGEERIYAWHYYMQGLMHLENEEWMEALKNFEKANQDYPGYWLFEEHLAETLSQLGRLEEAEEIYKGVILKTQASEFYFAMAATLNKKYSAKNDPAVLQSVQSFVNLGIEKLEEELKILPEAVSAHAMEALLDFAHPRFPAERVLAMAKQNLKMRPNGESKILYSKVLRHQGKTEESKKIFCEILRTSYRAPQVLLLLKKWQLSSQDCAKK